MIVKLTTNLMNTYNAINEKYYANKKLKMMEAEAAAKAAKAKAALLGGGGTSGVSASGQIQYNDGHDDKDFNYIVQPHELLANRYVVDHSIGKGSFGRVVKAFDTQSKKYVAIKIVKSKSAFFKQAQIELKLLLSLQAEADKWNIVCVIDQFLHKSHQCIVFELLSLNLYELLRNTRFTGVSLKLIAKFGQQLLLTLGHLNSKERGEKRIIHCDLKPENIRQSPKDREEGLRHVHQIGGSLLLLCSCSVLSASELQEERH
jgi:dual specificity tyrosine-phosphorylation-regulated kinase 1